VVARRTRKTISKEPSRLPQEIKLDLNLLSVIVAVLNTGSVTQAALKLGVSQPTVSAALAKLRTHFNDPLFVRSAEGMSPTPRGAAVASAAREILRQVDEKLQPEVKFEPSRRHRPFTFAMSDVGEIVFLPRIVKAVATAAPDTAVRSISMRPALLARALEEGEVDLAVGYFPDLKNGDFFQQRLFRHHFVCLLRANHPIQGDKLAMGDFLGLKHVVVQSEGRSQEIFEDYLEAHGLERHVSVYTPHFLSIRRLIAQSDMVATVPHALGIEYGNAVYDLKVMEPPFLSPRIELRQHWHRKAHKDARNVWLRKLISSLFNEATDEW
jgi:DNA-binding transcriptional LysR family regulator